MRSDELPWQDPPEELERLLGQIRTSTSTQEWARVWARRFAPSLSQAGIASLASYGAVTKGRGAMMTETEMLGRVDLRPLLPTIRVLWCCTGRRIRSSRSRAAGSSPQGSRAPGSSSSRVATP
jgi:hypothetical protein